MIFSFLVETKSLFPRVGARDIRIVKGWNNITDSLIKIMKIISDIKK